jgi:hypothetical protein
VSKLSDYEWLAAMHEAAWAIVRSYEVDDARPQKVEDALAALDRARRRLIGGSAMSSPREEKARELDSIAEWASMTNNGDVRDMCRSAAYRLRERERLHNESEAQVRAKLDATIPSDASPGGGV